MSHTSRSKTKPSSILRAGPRSMPEVFIIAELAQGYEGKPQQAMALLDAAAQAGADAAKFQLVYAEELATPDYQHFALFKKLEMADDVWAELSSHARSR